MMKILVVEDEAGIAAFLKQGLEEEGFTVDVADNGLLGLSMAKQNSYDLLLLDWMLPGMNGVEICTQFRKTNTKTPILFLTAKDTLDETIVGLQAGANDYIKKPFHFEELLERIKIHFRTAERPQEEYHLADVTLNTTTHLVTKSGQEIALTQKEFALLEYLLKNKGKVCKRREIIEQVWDIHFDYSTAVIDVYINALRKKLMQSETDSFIQTIRGVGYIAKAE